jgi:hypothetical protein
VPKYSKQIGGQLDKYGLQDHSLSETHSSFNQQSKGRSLLLNWFANFGTHTAPTEYFPNHSRALNSISIDSKEAINNPESNFSALKRNALALLYVQGIR